MGSSLLIGAQPVSRLESTTNLQLLFQALILLKFLEQSACCQILLQLLRPGQGLTISLISCTPSVLLFTGMLEKVWKRESSLKLGKIWLHSKKIMKKLEWIHLRVKEKQAKNIKQLSSSGIFVKINFLLLLYLLKNHCKTVKGSHLSMT